MVESQPAEFATYSLSRSKGKAEDLLAQIRRDRMWPSVYLQQPRLPLDVTIGRGVYRGDNRRRSIEPKDEAVRPDSSAVPPAANITGHSEVGMLRAINNSSP
jgi:hypothetical protein